MGDIAMPWWGWIALGTILLGAEMALIDADFYLVFIGLSALLVGLADLLGINLPAWAEFLVFAALAGASMILFRRRLYLLVRGGAKGVETVPTGDPVRVETALDAGETGRVAYRGSTWTAENVGAELIPAGGVATIERVDGTVLKVTKKS
jgi:membrane protein implicated in regulation of membrane protease activity